MPSPILLAELDGSDGFVLRGEPPFLDNELIGVGLRGFYLDGGGDANGDGFADVLIGGFGRPSRGGLLFGDGGAFSAAIDMRSFDQPGSQGLRFNDFNGTESGLMSALECWATLMATAWVTSHLAQSLGIQTPQALLMTTELLLSFSVPLIYSVIHLSGRHLTVQMALERMVSIPK